MLKIKNSSYVYRRDYVLENGVELYDIDWNGEIYTNGFYNGKDTNKRYIPIYDKDYEIIGFEED